MCGVPPSELSNFIKSICIHRHVEVFLWLRNMFGSALNLPTGFVRNFLCTLAEHSDVTLVKTMIDKFEFSALDLRCAFFPDFMFLNTTQHFS